MHEVMELDHSKYFILIKFFIATMIIIISSFCLVNDECDSGSHQTKILLEEDTLPTVDETGN